MLLEYPSFNKDKFWMKLTEKERNELLELLETENKMNKTHFSDKTVANSIKTSQMKKQRNEFLEEEKKDSDEYWV